MLIKEAIKHHTETMLRDVMKCLIFWLSLRYGGKFQFSNTTVLSLELTISVCNTKFGYYCTCGTSRWSSLLWTLKLKLVQSQNVRVYLSFCCLLRKNPNSRTVPVAETNKIVRLNICWKTKFLDGDTSERNKYIFLNVWILM